MTQTFISILMTDVIDATKRHDQNGTQAHKRDLARAIFAGIEGIVWVFREHVIDSAKSTCGLEPLEEAAIAETSWAVSDQGKVSEQRKFVPLLSSLRLLARIANRVAPPIKFDFAGLEWSNLKSAIEVRNRITHPKSAGDLSLSANEIESSQIAMYWLV